MIKYDSGVADNIIGCINSAEDSINGGIAEKVKTDYSDFISLGLFSSGIENINKAATALAESYTSFVGVIGENKNLWGEVQKEVEKAVDTFATDTQSTTRTGTPQRTYSSPRTGTPQTPSDVQQPPKGKKVSVSEVKELLAKIDSSVLPILLQKINKLANGTSITDLLLDKTKAQELTKILKEILGDTEGADEALSDCEELQKIILSKLGLADVDITTDEGKEKAKKIILETLKKEVDESKWTKLLYGDNTIKKDLLDGSWIVAKTTQDLEKYYSYVQSAGVKQDANTKDWGSSCLAFAGAHAYDLYAGTTTSGPSAANYAHGGAFTDFMSDDKQEVLAKIYDEIMQGRPVVLQVNGNKQGTSRHFVTVVGFRDGVVSGSTLKETDLLIMDSWDGKIERMDTSTSRFMTSGKDCGKEYSGYRLRILKG